MRHFGALLNKITELQDCSKVIQIKDSFREISRRLQDIYRNPHLHRHTTKAEMYACCSIEPYAVSSELYYAHIDSIPNPPWQGN